MLFLVFQMACASRKQYDAWFRRDILRIQAEEEEE